MQRTALDPAASRAVLEGLAARSPHDDGPPHPGPRVGGIEHLLPPDDPELGKHFSWFRYSVFRQESLRMYAGTGEDEGIAASTRGQ